MERVNISNTLQRPIYCCDPPSVLICRSVHLFIKKTSVKYIVGRPLISPPHVLMPLYSLGAPWRWQMTILAFNEQDLYVYKSEIRPFQIISLFLVKVLVGFSMIWQEKKTRHFNHLPFYSQRDDSPSPQKSKMLCCKRCIRRNALLFDFVRSTKNFSNPI